MDTQRIWCGFWTEDIIGSFFFEKFFENAVGQAITVNDARYYNNSVFLPKLQDMNVDDMWFQQDDTTARETIQLLHVISFNFHFDYQN